MTEATTTTTATPAPTLAAMTATIELLGKSYQFRCLENEVPALQKAAHYLNEAMKALPGAGKLLPPEKLGIMVALNLASQLLELEQQMSQNLHFLNQRITNLQTKLDTALDASPTGDRPPAL